MTQLSRGRRRGNVFSVRITDEERAALERLQGADNGPRSLGPWLVWRALDGDAPGTTQARPEAVPARAESRVILDLCGGSGAWSQPYADAGYTVIVVDAADPPSPLASARQIRKFLDVRTFVPPSLGVHGVLAAPPCTEFSIARNGHPDRPRDFVGAMSVVNACMRIVLQCRPQWWALENPAGHLSKFLGAPRDTWEPCDFGDPWTKRTCIWGEYRIPRRGPFVQPTESAMRRPTAAARAITPPGFARAFFEANP